MSASTHRRSQVTVATALDGDDWVLEVRDDGRGFDAGAVAARGRRNFGLQFMRERAELDRRSLRYTIAAGRGHGRPAGDPDPRRGGAEGEQMSAVTTAVPSDGEAAPIDGTSGTGRGS